MFACFCIHRYNKAVMFLEPMIVKKTMIIITLLK